MVAERADPPSGKLTHAEGQRDARSRRKVADEIFYAFHFACDVRDFEVADRLLRVLENLLITRAARPTVSTDGALALLVAAHERLWLLRHPARDN